MLISDERVPYGVQRVGPAVDLALENVNSHLLNDSYTLTAVKIVYDNICDARFATGKFMGGLTFMKYQVGPVSTTV